MVILSKTHPYVVGFEKPTVRNGVSRFFKPWSVEWVDFSTTPRAEFFDTEEEAMAFSDGLVERFTMAPVAITEDDVAGMSLSDCEEYWNNVLLASKE